MAPGVQKILINWNFNKFVTNWCILEPKSPPPHVEITVSKKSLYLFQIFHCIPCEVFFVEKLKCKRKYLSDKYAALMLIRSNATGQRRKIFSAATPDTQLFDIYTKKYHKNKYKNYLKKRLEGKELSLFLKTTHSKDYINFIIKIKLIF